MINAHIIETGDSLYGVQISVNGHKIIGDEPESYGSKNLGPAPYDLLLAALGECTDNLPPKLSSSQKRSHYQRHPATTAKT